MLLHLPHGNKNRRSIVMMQVLSRNTQIVEIHFTSSFLQQYTFYVGSKKEKFVFPTGNSAKQF